MFLINLLRSSNHPKREMEDMDVVAPPPPQKTPPPPPLLSELAANPDNPMALISMFAGRDGRRPLSETDHLLNKRACFPTPSEYRSPPDSDNKCDDFAPYFNEETGCCTSRDIMYRQIKAEVHFMRAMALVSTKVENQSAISPAIVDVAEWIQKTGRSVQEDTVFIDKDFPWYEKFMKFLFVAGIRQDFEVY